MKMMMRAHHRRHPLFEGLAVRKIYLHELCFEPLLWQWPGVAVYQQPIYSARRE